MINAFLLQQPQDPFDVFDGIVRVMEDLNLNQQKTAKSKFRKDCYYCERINVTQSVVLHRAPGQT